MYLTACILQVKVLYAASISMASRPQPRQSTILILCHRGNYQSIKTPRHVQHNFIDSDVSILLIIRIAFYTLVFGISRQAIGLDKFINYLRSYQIVWIYHNIRSVRYCRQYNDDKTADDVLWTKKKTSPGHTNRKRENWIKSLKQHFSTNWQSFYHFVASLRTRFE